MKILKNFCVKYFFLGFPLLYALIYAPYGFESYDTGFILGLSWQFITGSIPYSDIIYVRPPASYIFHSIFFLIDNNYTIIINRVFVYFEVAIYSYLAILMLAKKFKIENPFYISFITSLSFIFSMHTFPPMAWHTIDGIFFCVLGLFFIFNYSKHFHIVIGGIFLILGALSKQPFILVTLTSLLLIIYQKEFKRLIFCLVGIMLMIFIFILYLKFNNSLYAFVNLVSGQTNFSDLIDFGILRFVIELEEIKFVLVPPALLAIFLSGSKFKDYCLHYFYILILWILTFSTYAYLRNDDFTKDIYFFGDSLFLLTLIIVLLKMYKYNSEKYFVVLLLLILAWTSSVSWGYNTVVLFSAPMIFLLSLPILKVLDNSYHKILTFGIIIFGFITFYIGYQNPYKLYEKSKRKEIVYSMDKIYPKLIYIYGDKKTYLEYQELKLLITKYKSNFTVLPGSTLIHFLSDTKNPIGIDWVLNAEVNNQEEKILNILERKDIAVFVLKTRTISIGKFNSDLTESIVENWQKVEEGKFYDVYRFNQ